jgi:16S rRNA (cytosine967-C5)-methyltransferase
MISPARKLSYKILARIESGYLFSDDALNSEDADRLEARDRRLTTEIVYGTLRWQALLDYVLEKSSARPWHEVSPRARILLRMSLYQMWQMDRIPDHALVNDSVELAKRQLGKGIDRYLNGILRHLARTRPWKEDSFLSKAPLWVQVSLPQWLWDRWVDRYDARSAKAFALSLNVPPQTAMRFTEGTRRYELPPLGAVPSDLVPDAYIRCNDLCGRETGEQDESALVQFQDEASQLIPHLLGPAGSGWRIWDACAAPGGKSAILTWICGENGYLIASDLRKQRVSRLVETLKRSCALKADVIIADASLPAPFRDCFDAVLADVPCSGLGTLRRNPEIKWRFQPERLTSLQQIQKRILRKVSETVRVGGRLLYSTCSTEPEENEQVIESFLDTHSGFDLIRPVYPRGIENWTCQDRMVRTFPGTRLWDGFFAALLVRLR